MNTNDIAYYNILDPNPNSFKAIISYKDFLFTFWFTGNSWEWMGRLEHRDNLLWEEPGFMAYDIIEMALNSMHYYFDIDAWLSQVENNRKSIISDAL